MHLTALFSLLQVSLATNGLYDFPDSKAVPYTTFCFTGGCTSVILLLQRRWMSWLCYFVSPFELPFPGLTAP
jgi:hypothetical protein